ncbi:MAG: hypothetical protein EPN99_06845 [Frankiales bacterium]|nr:MAG: hypothetical protein EPN99_06845 [Frankiales bacterium]
MRIRGALAVLCVLAALVGCSDDPEPLTLPPITSASPSPLVVPLPSEAAAETPEGAAAFARYFFGEVVDGAYVDLNAEPVVALSTEQCDSCKNIVDDIERLRDAGLIVAGERFKIAFAEAPPVNADGSVIVDFRFTSDPYVERNAEGEVVRQEDAQVDQDAQVKLVRREGGWAVDAIRTVE